MPLLSKKFSNCKHHLLRKRTNAPEISHTCSQQWGYLICSRGSNTIFNMASILKVYSWPLLSHFVMEFSICLVSTYMFCFLHYYKFWPYFWPSFSILLDSVCPWLHIHVSYNDWLEHLCHWINPRCLAQLQQSVGLLHTWHCQISQTILWMWLLRKEWFTLQGSRSSFETLCINSQVIIQIGYWQFTLVISI